MLCLPERHVRDALVMAAYRTAEYSIQLKSEKGERKCQLSHISLPFAELYVLLDLSIFILYISNMLQCLRAKWKSYWKTIYETRYPISSVQVY